MNENILSESVKIIPLTEAQRKLNPNYSFSDQLFSGLMYNRSDYNITNEQMNAIPDVINGEKVTSTNKLCLLIEGAFRTDKDAEGNIKSLYDNNIYYSYDNNNQLVKEIRHDNKPPELSLVLVQDVDFKKPFVLGQINVAEAVHKFADSNSDAEKKNNVKAIGL